MFITNINIKKKERINSEKKNNYKSPLSLYENNIISTNIFNFDFSEIKKNIRNLENSIKTFSFKNFIPTKKNNNVYFKIKDNFQEKKTDNISFIQNKNDLYYKSKFFSSYNNLNNDN